MPKRFEAYGWHTSTVADGNDLEAIDAAIREAQSVSDKPSLISVKTIIGFGMPTQGTRKAHSDAPGEEAVRETKRHLGWPEDRQFYVPDEALAHFREAVERGSQQEGQWKALVEKYEEQHADLGSQWRSTVKGEQPAARETPLPIFKDASQWRRGWRAAKSSTLSRRTCDADRRLGRSWGSNIRYQRRGDFEAGSYEAASFTLAYASTRWDRHLREFL